MDYNFENQEIQNESSQINDRLNILREREERLNKKADELLCLLTSLKEQREQQNQIQTCDETENNSTLTDIENFQITTLEIENNHLDEVFQNSTNDLDFNSFQKKDLSLDFDLSLSKCEKFEIFEIEQNENVEFFKNSKVENDFNKHELFGVAK